MPPTLNERVLPTLNVDGTRRWIRPKLSKGRFFNARLITAWVLIAIFTIIPYIKVAGKPLVLLNIPAREFTILGRTFLPSDSILLMLLIFSVFLGAFLVTALWGRVWCGWACPQTVYMEYVFRPIERLLEGTPQQQQHIDKAGGFHWRRFVKTGVFFFIAIYLAHTFLAYFVGVDALKVWVTRSPFEHPVSFLVMAFTTFAMLLDFGYFREQVCFVACPYGRFQSVLLDRRSMIVGYDAIRGEPRGKVKNENGIQRGDCVDCKACVVTCPTGIDIREGLQLECIGCTQCIDACDTIMDRLQRPRGLIRYASQDALAGKKTSVLRPRVVIYSILLVGVFSTFLYLLSIDRTAELTLLRGIGAPFVVMSDGRVQNQLRVKVRNRTADDHAYEIRVAGIEGAQIIAPANPLHVKAKDLVETTVFVLAPATAFASGVRDIKVELVDEAGKSHARNYRLLGPGSDPANSKLQRL